MEKIKFITDSACDLPGEYAQNYNIEVMPISIIIDDQEYISEPNDNALTFYELLESSKDIPKTSQITIYQFLERFERIYKEGYTHVIGLFLPSFASGTYQNAILAREEFYANYPEAKSFVIEIPDTQTYSLGYGYPLVQAAEMAKQGKGFDDILDFVKEWLEDVDIYFSMYTLEFARKSGRIGVVSAIVGDALGLKPIIRIKNGELSTYKKIRGKKMVIKEMMHIAEENMRPGSEYMLLHGKNTENGEEFKKLMNEQVGYAPFGVFFSGPAVTINAGTEIIGMGFRSK